MPDWNLVNRAHVLAALEEYDRLGSREFLSRYRFGRSTAYTLWHGGQEYDSKAVLGVAYLHATGRAATRDELAGSLGGGAKVLERLGFDVAVDEQEAEREERAVRARAERAAASTARAGAGSATAGKVAGHSASTRAGAAPRAARKVAEKKPARIKPAEREVKLCPTCYTALPATGVCDFCE